MQLLAEVLPVEVVVCPFAHWVHKVLLASPPALQLPTPQLWHAAPPKPGRHTAQSLAEVLPAEAVLWPLAHWVQLVLLAGPPALQLPTVHSWQLPFA